MLIVHPVIRSDAILARVVIAAELVITVDNAASWSFT
jgi:hypothetical protein